MDLDLDVTWDLALRALLAGLLVVAVAGVVYLAVTPGVSDPPFTEFYILGPGGNATDYPTNLSTGESGEFVVGVTNHEKRPMTYTVALVVENRTLDTLTLDVENDATREERMTVSLSEPGRYRLEILLYRGGTARTDTEPYHRLRLFVNVTAPEQSLSSGR